MATKGLGRGLSALFSDTEEAYENAQTENTSGVRELPLSDIYPNPDQPRKIFDEGALNDLASSIREHGVISPIVVNAAPDGRYMIIAGERRYRAAGMAGLTAIPAVVKEYSEREIREIRLIENLQREDLNPIEAADAMKQLMDEYHLTQEELANRLGYQDVEYVTVLPENRKEMLLDGQIDLIAGCYSIADTRLENFDFSPAYYDDKVIAVVQNSSLIESIDDMKGLTFGTMSGANAAPLLSIKLYEIGFSDGEARTLGADNNDVQFDTWHLLQFPSYQELSDALEDGTVDAMVLDGAIAHTYLDDKRHMIDGFVVAEQSFGVATQKDSELSAPVAEAVQGMLDDGTIDALVDKWD